MFGQRLLILSSKRHIIDCALVTGFYRYNMASEMAPVLHKLKLDHFIDKFSSEKITPDLVGKLSLSEFRELGVQNRNEVMKLRMECSKYYNNLKEEIYDPDDPRTFKSVCVKCHASRPLTNLSKRLCC